MKSEFSQAFIEQSLLAIRGWFELHLFTSRTPWIPAESKQLIRVKIQLVVALNLISPWGGWIIKFLLVRCLLRQKRWNSILGFVHILSQIL